jgi:hypothetical protein
VLVAVGQEGAVLLVGFVAVAAVAWGAVLSVRSAVRGPEWALDHMRTVRRFLPILIAAGIAVVFLVSPVWAGLAVVYVTALVWWLSGSLRRNLERIEGEGGFAPIPPESRHRIVRRARGLLVVAGILLLAIAAVGIGSGMTALVTASLGLVLMAAAGLLGRESTTG